jgi:hypothetical protein
VIVKDNSAELGELAKCHANPVLPAPDHITRQLHSVLREINVKLSGILIMPEMNQSRVMSLVEVMTSSLIGLVFANRMLLPIFFGLHPSLTASFWMTVMFMVLSIVRGYLVRQFFAAMRLASMRGARICTTASPT